MALKKVGQKDHQSRKNPGSREKWLQDKKAGRPKQSYDLATKTYAKTFPSGVKA
jgi:hypothetical protein